MNQQDQIVINNQLEHDFFFIELPPNNVDDGIWKNRNGEFIFMEEMGLDYLKSCIHTCKNAISRLKESARRKIVKDTLIPLAEKKLEELESEFDKKT